jgi:hypothetical protein
MQKNLLTLAVILIQTIFCFGQVGNLDIKSSEYSTTKSCPTKVENKAIGLSNITSDTLTIQQFSECNKVTINNMSEGPITFYKILYFLPNGTDLVERAVLNDSLSEELIQKVIASGTKKIFLSEVSITKGTENISLGYRSFYLN